MKFEVGEGRCRLVWPNDEALRPLREKPVPAMQLLQQLIFHGINLLPCNDDADQISQCLPCPRPALCSAVAACAEPVLGSARPGSLGLTLKRDQARSGWT